MIEVRNLSVKLGAFSLQDISLTVQRGEYFILLGPTGAGKTVLLESIAGVQQIQAGEIWLSGKDVTKMEPERRRTSIVYQDHMLFPHLSVQENIIFGPKMRGEEPGQIAMARNRVVDLLGIEHLLYRKPDTLSGGEKQKVALARAIVTDPQVLLLDEPLGALDPQTRDNVQQELLKLQDELGITVLHVTHDFEEAITMGDRIAVIGEGAIQQVGLPDEVFRHPNSVFVARFTMTANVFTGTAHKEADGKTYFLMDGVRMITGADMEGLCHASIRPEDILVSDSAAAMSTEDGCNHFTATVSQVINKGSVVHLVVNIPLPMTCLVTHHYYQQMDLQVGQKAYIAIEPSSVHLFQD
jgi:ABC-type Fe3+/spermidine/putrescine transport system ATPase subunit